MARPNRLRRLREAQGMHRMQLALNLGVHEMTVHRWEQGNAIPEKYWDRLSEQFGVSIAYVLGLEEDNGNGNGGGLRAVDAA